MNIIEALRSLVVMIVAGVASIIAIAIQMAVKEISRAVSGVV